MADIRRLPFTELVERLQKELLRDNSAAEAKYKGKINDMYMFGLPPLIDWRHVRIISSITTVDDYSTGYVSAASSTTLTGSGTTWTSANSNNALIKISGYDELYRCTYVSATSLTIDRSWIGTAISSNTSYSLFQDRYALASDFDRLILDPNRSVYYYQNGNKVYLKYRDPDEFEDMQTYLTNIPEYYTVKWVSGDPYLFVDPPDNDDRTIYYVYIPTLKRMSEYTTGYITTLANGGTAVTGSGTDFDGFVTDTTNYDYYLRIDPDGTGSASVWYKISSASSDTAVTLSDAYNGTAISSGTSTTGAYTISMVSRLPSGLDLAILYGAAIVGATDQTNTTQIKAWSALHDRALQPYMAVEGKLKYGQSRIRTIYEKAGVRR